LCNTTLYEHVFRKNIYSTRHLPLQSKFEFRMAFQIRKLLMLFSARDWGRESNNRCLKSSRIHVDRFAKTAKEIFDVWSKYFLLGWVEIWGKSKYGKNVSYFKFVNIFYNSFCMVNKTLSKIKKGIKFRQCFNNALWVRQTIV
jgi:hypothetical protein